MSTGLLPQVGRIHDLLRWRSNISPGALALKVGDLQWSYGDLQERVSKLSAVLQELGVKKGKRVAILLRPTEGFVALVLALARIGGIAVPLNPRQSTTELRSQILDSDPALIVYDDVLSVDAERLEGTEPNQLRRGKAGIRRRWVRISELMASRPRRPVVGELLDGSSPHVIIYTSGSSGAPKGALLTLSNLIWNAISVGFRIGVSSGDRWLLCLPLFHVGGFSVIYRSLLYGNAIVVHASFEAAPVSRSLDDDDITLVSFVPTMLVEVFKARGAKPLDPKVRAIFVGGGQAPEQLLQEIRRRRIPVLLTYGMTETCSQVAVSKVGFSAELGYRALPPTELAVVRAGAKGRLVFAPPGQVGEIAVRGPTVLKGYWRRPALTRAKFRRGWFLTGDLGTMRDGKLAPLGRREETIVSGGEKVLPSEVEDALREYPGVRDAVVIGITDSKWGERVVAVVELEQADGQKRPSGHELDLFMKGKVGRHKIPKEYHFWATLPRTPAGKARRAEVRRRLERGGDLG